MRAFLFEADRVVAAGRSNYVDQPWIFRKPRNTIYRIKQIYTQERIRGD